MKMSYVLVPGLALIGCIANLSALAAEPTTQSVQHSAEFIYKDNCSVCHGDHGDGRSRASNGLIPPPRNFTEAGELTRDYMIETVTNGKAGTAMTSWKTRLNKQQIELVVDYVRGKFMTETIELYSASGRMAYNHYCKSCHGEQGQGVLAVGLTVPPRSFSTRDSRDAITRERMIAAITHGMPGTIMPSYKEKLNPGQVGAVVDYVRNEIMVKDTASNTVSATSIDMSLPLPTRLVANPALGEQFFMGNCATCHGTLGDGQGPRAYFMTVKPRNFLDDRSRTTLNRPAIFSAIKLGRPGTEMPAWGRVLSEQEIANIAEFVFANFIQSKAKANTSN